MKYDNLEIIIIQWKPTTIAHNNKHNKRTTTKHCTSTLQKKLNDTLNPFKDQFCINKAIAKIENNSLKVILTEKIDIKSYK